MKIAFIDIQFDYGIEARGKNCISQDGFKSALERLGHEVVPFYYDQYLNNTKPLQEKLVSFIAEEKPDLAFFIIFRDHFNPSTLDEVKKYCTTVNWFGDDSWRFDNYTKKYAPHFSYSITTDKFSLPKYRSLGIEDVFLSQWAAIDSYSVPARENLDLDVSFIGAKHPYREWFTSTLQKRGIKVECFGPGWKNGPLSSDDMNLLFARSKISLNLSNSVSYDLRYMFSGWKPFIYSLKSSKSMSQIKARNFEINYFNGFQLTDYAPTIENYYKIGDEVLCFSNIDEAEMLIKYYLENDTEREEIQKKGHLKALEHHGYYHRLEEFFGWLSKIKRSHRW